MNAAPRSLQWMVWGGMALTILIIAVAFILQTRRGDDSKDDSRPDQLSPPLPVLFEVTDFALTNQNGEIVTRADLAGKVWIADIIFTSCAGPCPEMTRRMAGLQTTLAPAVPVRFVTLTAHPEFDTPEILRAYGRRFRADAGRWHFLTGTKKQIVDLAVNGLKLTTVEKEPGQRENPNDLFIHSTLFVVVDQRGRARAVVESDDAEMSAKVLRIVDQLLQEK